MRDFFNKRGEQAGPLSDMKLLQAEHQFCVWNWPAHLIGPGNEKHFATFCPAAGILVCGDTVHIGLAEQFDEFEAVTEQVIQALVKFTNDKRAIGVGLTSGDEEDQENYPDALWLTVIAPTKEDILDFVTATSLPGEEDTE